MAHLIAPIPIKTEALTSQSRVLDILTDNFNNTLEAAERVAQHLPAAARAPAV